MLVTHIVAVVVMSTAFIMYMYFFKQITSILASQSRISCLKELRFVLCLESVAIFF